MQRLNRAATPFTVSPLGTCGMALDARNYFDPATNGSKGRLQRNQFGGMRQQLHDVDADRIVTIEEPALDLFTFKPELIISSTAEHRSIPPWIEFSDRPLVPRRSH